MILTKNIQITINNRYVNFYKNLGYNIRGGSIITIPIEHLMKTSHQKIKVKCDYCGSEKELAYRRYLLSFENGDKYACVNCSHLKTKKYNLEKYGIENVFQLDKTKEKINKTNLEKYGCKSPLQNEEILNKVKLTNKERYGVDNVFQLDEIKEKSKNTSILKYGKEYANQSDYVRNKMKDTNLNLYGFEFAMQNKNIIEKSKKNKISSTINNSLSCFKENNIISIDFINKDYTLKCDCGKDHNYEIQNKLLNNRKYNSKTTLCTICNPLKSLKGLENQLYDFIRGNYEGKILRNVRKILDNKYELDIYLPELKIAFEFNGMYWHNENNKPEEYHKNKFEKCFSKKINLIYIWEDDWINNDGIKKYILSILDKTKKLENYVFSKNTKNIKFKLGKDIKIIANIRRNFVYNIINNENYDLNILYEYIKNNNLILILDSYSNILQYDFDLLNVIEKKIYFEKGGFNFYNIDKFYLKPIQ